MFNPALADTGRDDKIGAQPPGHGSPAEGPSSLTSKLREAG